MGGTVRLQGIAFVGTLGGHDLRIAARDQNLAAYGVGWRGDTPPLKGCCTVTFGYRARTC
jgi:hypothetical protein